MRRTLTVAALATAGLALGAPAALAGTYCPPMLDDDGALVVVNADDVVDADTTLDLDDVLRDVL